MGSSSRHLSYAWLLVDPSDNKTNVFFHFTLSINIFLGFRQKIYCLSITISVARIFIRVLLQLFRKGTETGGGFDGCARLLAGPQRIRSFGGVGAKPALLGALD
jgi:hypothetical protein